MMSSCIAQATTHELITDSYLPVESMFSAISSRQTTTNAMGQMLYDSALLVAGIDDCFTSFRIYHTKVHMEIFSFLAHRAVQLFEGVFINKVGASSSALVGSRGIGMSFTLKAFAMAAPNLIPRMLTIYFSMKGLDGHCGRRESLGKTVFDEICRILAVPVGVEPAVEQIDFRQSIVDILVNMDFHLMLLVDDVQHMYTFDGDRHQNAIDTLGDLSFFADQPSGRVLVVLCGDVAFTEKLVSHTFDRSTTFAQNFPLLRTGGYRLTKFQVFRISSTIPTDLEAVASITNVQLNNQNRNWLRLVTFMSGCCASDVERFKNELGIGHLAPRCSGCLDGYTIIYDKLYKKNKKLCDALFRGALDNTCTCSILDNIMTAPWERTFQPVTRSAVVFSIRRLVSRGKMDKRHLDCFDDYIEDIANINMSNIHIYDKSIYPSSMYTLMLHVLKRGFEPAVVDRFRAIVRDLPANAAAILGNPRVIAAVATSPAPAAGCTMI